MHDESKSSSITEGLDHLFGVDEPKYSNASPKLLPVSSLTMGAYQTREVKKDQKLQELADSIKAYGVIQAILVRPANEQGEYELIAGHRRWQASKLAGLIEIPAKIVDINEQTVAAYTLIENIQRENLNAVEEAKGYQKLLDDFNLTHDEVAERVGKPRTTISNFLRLLRLDSTVQQWLIARKINMGHAKVLLTLDHEDQIRVGEMIIGRQLSVRQTEDLVRKHNREDRKEAPKVDLELLERADQVKHDLSQHFGRRVDVKLKNTNEEKGYVKLPFNSLGDLSDLLSLLMVKTSVFQTEKL